MPPESLVHSRKKRPAGEVQETSFSNSDGARVNNLILKPEYKVNHILVIYNTLQFDSDRENREIGGIESDEIGHFLAFLGT